MGKDGCICQPCPSDLAGPMQKLSRILGLMYSILWLLTLDTNPHYEAEQKQALADLSGDTTTSDGKRGVSLLWAPCLLKWVHACPLLVKDELRTCGDQRATFSMTSFKMVGIGQLFNSCSCFYSGRDMGLCIEPSQSLPKAISNATILLVKT